MASDDGSNNTFPLGLVAARIAQSKKRTRHLENSIRQICPHCNQSLCSKTFKRHKRLYKKEDGSWMMSEYCNEPNESKLAMTLCLPLSHN